MLASLNLCILSYIFFLAIIKYKLLWTSTLQSFYEDVDYIFFLFNMFVKLALYNEAVNRAASLTII